MTHQYMSAIDLLKKYKSKTLSPSEVIQSTFKQINQHNPELNAFVTLNEEGAVSEARQAEEMYARNIHKPLLGIPIAIKDLTNTKGLRTTYGSLLHKDYIPDRDATVISRLRNAGAIIVGKTNSPEFGHKATTDNPLFGPSKNPWNTQKTTGGSSGGSAAAVASGMVPLAEGSDGGGSIRIPASLCGVFGFKPTYGRIPFDNHLDGIFSSHEPFLHHGPISRHVLDAVLMYDVMQGYSTTDPFSLPTIDQEILHHVMLGTKNLRIGYTMDFGMYEVDDGIQKQMAQALSNFKQIGFQVEEIPINFGMSLDQYIRFFENLWTVGLASGLATVATKHPSLFSDSIKTMIKHGQSLSAIEFKQLESTRAFLWHTMQDYFKHYDAIVSPTLATTAFDYSKEGPSYINNKPIRESSDWVMTQIYNLTGLPSASLPIGFDDQRLPIGMQIACNRLEDIQLLQLAYTYEKHFSPQSD